MDWMEIFVFTYVKLRKKRQKVRKGKEKLGFFKRVLLEYNCFIYGLVVYLVVFPVAFICTLMQKIRKGVLK